MMGGGKDPVQKFGIFRFPEGNRFDAPELRLGVEACRLVGLDPDQLSLQAPFPEGLPTPMARQLAPGEFMLRSGRPTCGPISLLAQESGSPQLRPESALLFSGWPQDLFGLVLFRKGTHVQKGVKNE